ncbi:hypothetical protein DFJ77DRAFT_551875 [Powellomyces hirtus]|nr:hypothetical protein DFJ77DRAFT_551875 [Powellomyces hirtus]
MGFEPITNFWTAAHPQVGNGLMSVFQDPTTQAVWVHAPAPYLRKYVEARTAKPVSYVVVSRLDQIKKEWTKDVKLVCPAALREVVEADGWLVYDTCERLWGEKGVGSWMESTSWSRAQVTEKSVTQLDGGANAPLEDQNADQVKKDATDGSAKTSLEDQEADKEKVADADVAALIETFATVVLDPNQEDYADMYWDDLPAHGLGDDYLECADCGEVQHRTRFSARQRKLGERRKCLECVKAFEQSSTWTGKKNISDTPMAQTAAALEYTTPLFKTWKNVGDELESGSKVSAKKRIDHYASQNVHKRRGDGDGWTTSEEYEEEEHWETEDKWLEKHNEAKVAVTYVAEFNEEPACFLLQVAHGACVLITAAQEVPAHVLNRDDGMFKVVVTASGVEIR